MVIEIKSVVASGVGRVVEIDSERPQAIEKFCILIRVWVAQGHMLARTDWMVT